MEESYVRHAGVSDLYRVPENGKAELVDGKLMLMEPTGGLPAFAAAEIFASLREHANVSGSGHALPDNVGFLVDLPNRRSFSPDAAYFQGELTMSFIEGAPLFAAEVRSLSDYGRAAEGAIARKRADYFAAGTLVVWDVDLAGIDVVRVYRAGHAIPAVYRAGDRAEAEPAVPGWTMPVIDLFP